MLKYCVSLATIIVVIIACSTTAFGQQLTGCLLPSGNIHYQANGFQDGFTNYNTNPNVSSASVFCEQDVLIDAECRVNKKKNPANQGTKVTFYLVQCPIDDYIPFMILAVGGFGFFTVRRLRPTAN